MVGFFKNHPGFLLGDIKDIVSQQKSDNDWEDHYDIKK